MYLLFKSWLEIYFGQLNFSKVQKQNFCYHLIWLFVFNLLPIFSSLKSILFFVPFLSFSLSPGPLIVSRWVLFDTLRHLKERGKKDVK